MSPDLHPRLDSAELDTASLVSSSGQKEKNISYQKEHDLYYINII